MSTSDLYSVLVVDDEPGLRLGLQANFVREGWHVKTASRTSEALGELAQRAFDLVLCDVRMADGDGFEVLNAVRALGTSTAFLSITLPSRLDSTSS